MNKYIIKEKVLLFLYVLYGIDTKVNANTLKRYFYFYYIASSFISTNVETISISVERTTISIPFMDEILNDFSVNDYIVIDGKFIYIKKVLVDYVNKLLENTAGQFYYLYQELVPFVNLIHSYDDEFIFTIFFKEPSFVDANDRNLNIISSKNSKLAKLLNRFKLSLEANSGIDDYDILTYWMDFVLKNYYSTEE